MIWKVELDGKYSYLAGTSHKFSYHFRDSLKELIKRTKKVVLEGPMDSENFDRVIAFGRSTPQVSLYDMLDSATIELLVDKLTSLYAEKTPPTFQVFVDFHIGTFYKRSIREILKRNRAWMAFFLIWYEFLEIHDWKYSIDMEILKIAKELDRDVRFLETIYEQIKALEGIPPEKIVDFFRYADNWNEYITNYEKLYLKGNLKELMELSKIFPTRCESIIENRDPILFERMLQYLREGDSLIAIGVTHIPGIINRAQKEGFSITSTF
ncbi:MAG: TraB/GumN family protein [Thermodesulfovibrio sp.]|nr:TraB/GumN family protein [Thermodesulfovibrio sp.]